HTKASSSCGGCTGLVEQILAAVVGSDAAPAEHQKPLCPCTEHSHDAVREAIRARHLTSIAQVMRELEWHNTDGCPTCRPALNYYLISTSPAEAQDDDRSRFVNELLHANIQKDRSYTVVPRIW